jgi:NitT/TauT family transport system ATP-binding protein
MIEFKDVEIKVGGKNPHILKYDLRIENGDQVMIVGPNGCGKTTFLDLIIGVRIAEKGSIDISDFEKPTAYAVQNSDSGLLPWLNVISNILLPARVAGTLNQSSIDIANSLLQTFNLIERTKDYPYSLSGGEKQIVNLIRTVCTPADLVLLDEPFVSLFEESRHKFILFFKNWLKGKTSIIVTHEDLDSFFDFTRYATFDDQGRLYELDVKDMKGIMKFGKRE